MSAVSAGPAVKDAGIQSLRGVAVVLMVAGHVIGGDDSGGAMAVAGDSGWRFSYEALTDVRMPLFTVLSGYVYAMRPVGATSELGRLVRGKVRRLLVPFVVVCTALFAVKLLAPGVNRRPDVGDLPGAYLFGFEHLWFLQSIFLIFLAVGLLDAFGLLGTWRQWTVAAGASAVIFIGVRVPGDLDVFSVNGALRLFPFFLLGYATHRYPAQLLRPRVLLVCALAFVPVYALRLGTIATDAEWPDLPDRTLSLGVGVVSVVLLLAVRRHLASRALAWLGGFSFGIYLLHVFGTSGLLVVIGGLGIESTVAQFVLGLVAGLALPVLFELLLGRFPLISWGVLGQRPNRRRAALAPVEAKAPTGDAVD